MTGIALGSWAWLLLLLLIPVGWLWGRRRRLRIPLPRAAAFAAGARPGPWRAWSPVWRAAALTFIAIALASPVLRLERVERRSEGVSIVIAFDVSSSMLAEDFRPQNRIEVARRAVRRFIEGRGEDRIGLVAFAGEALTVIPGSLDHNLILQAVRNLDVGRLEDGTAIGTALATSAARLRDVEEGARIVILLTDGDNNRGRISPLDAAAAAEALGIRVYTIGVGRDGMAPVPIGRTAFGYQYAMMEVNINDALLDSIARVTGGEYFRATEPEALESIYDRIDGLVRAPIREVRVVERAGLRSELVWAALAALALELLGAATRARRALLP